MKSVDDGRTDGRRTTDGRTTEHGYTISSPCEPDGSGELKILKQSLTDSYFQLLDSLFAIMALFDFNKQNYMHLKLFISQFILLLLCKSLPFLNDSFIG